MTAKRFYRGQCILLLILSIFMFSCSYDPIFYAIAQEIELEEPNVTGNVYSIVKLGGNLFVQNGNIYTKSVGTVRGWTQSSSPADERIVALASDDTYLYALAARQTDDEGEYHSYQVYASPGGTGTWTAVSGGSLSEVTSDEVLVIFDNAVIGGANDTTGRNAYMRVNTAVYQLDGTSALTNLTAVTTNGAGSSSVAAAALSTGDYFADTRAFCSNGNDLLYKANDTAVTYSSDTGTWTDAGISITDQTAFAYAGDVSKIYVGTSDGVEQITLNGTGIPTGTGTLDGNAEAAHGDAVILSIAFFGSIDNNAVYAGATYTSASNYNALWGYYPSRGNWNYE